MCGRYFQQRSSGEIAAHLGVQTAIPNLPPSFNKAPTQDGLVVRRHPETGEAHLDVLRWGLVPHWAKDASGGARMINARGESIAGKAAFRDPFRKRRCLVPMDGFYEWRKHGAAKQPFACALRSGGPMVCAGLWDGWKQPEGEWLRSYTIVTCASAGRQALLHERMPVILPREAWDRWLDPTAGDTELLGLLKPAEDALLGFWPVPTRVGRVAENDAGLIARDPLAVAPPELDDPPPGQAPFAGVA
ncbi:SOS response-associated peptidase [Roseomonas terrae]|uniref:Abasic site processing protein n=1 Tax=Neoroseomonas terrae TaxID=424799 RepID=A0ABS5EJ01_9PROT|nr:SOS response-associated peptidase [Neoroseomonas terrae]MBR0651009.1 SOS response-associated peptidase [Neoroseomonas terrae]